ncbi:Glucose--fructose oxidoreductase precursor [Vibrio aerogenes CECT 7868]|uniref:Glucose--fructose oxidoreductase n=1 Tax=Vibrio aerogenes CECT 7868 TaxID=1216006 RepID=A0A1M5ZRA4_9VIBR|nr:Gfo/Idh/MocA family oxidoreductase [Vibrio aerogenes]SHI26722.1 Glucose--fructose oxidoreductase precursor [Vibrio aerogenes CECT 7868]
MIHFAVIGTGWISEAFVKAAHQTGKMQLTAVYSRSLESALTFGQAFDVSLYYTDLKELAEETTIDAVYIASPNVMHCEQAILMMEHGKHVICEKPVASNYREAQRMDDVARRQQVVCMEAYRSRYLPNFAQIRAAMEKTGPATRAFFSYCQYSSRYDKYLAGENPNTFNPAFSNGSVMDIGFYPLAAAVALFGRPESVKAEGRLLDSGVDGEGSLILGYPDLTVMIQHSKVSDSVIPSEIQGKYGAIVIDHIADIQSVTVHYRDGNTEEMTVSQQEQGMFYEADFFAEAIINHQFPDRKETLLTAELLTEIRRQIGVIYPADQANMD